MSKKRKLHNPSPDEQEQEEEEKTKESQMMRRSKPVFESDFRSHHQFASEWQQCLDIKSGKIYFYNTKTNKRVLGSSDSNSSPENCTNNSSTNTRNNIPVAAPMSLELELNLPSQSLGGNNYKNNQNSQMKDDHDKGLARAPSWLTFEGEDQEMVTAVCRKCYMLVMMCKTSPSCPNCKFVHPTEAALTSSI